MPYSLFIISYFFGVAEDTCAGGDAYEELKDGSYSAHCRLENNGTPDTDRMDRYTLIKGRDICRDKCTNNTECTAFEYQANATACEIWKDAIASASSSLSESYWGSSASSGQCFKKCSTPTTLPAATATTTKATAPSVSPSDKWRPTTSVATTKTAPTSMTRARNATGAVPADDLFVVIDVIPAEAKFKEKANHADAVHVVDANAGEATAEAAVYTSTPTTTAPAPNNGVSSATTAPSANDRTGNVGAGVVLGVVILGLYLVARWVAHEYRSTIDTIIRCDMEHFQRVV